MLDSQRPKNPLYTALPEIPDAEAMIEDLRKIIGARWLSNNGAWVQKFEKEIGVYLGHRNLQVITVSNATVGLEAILRVLGLRGKVILSPFTFVSTAHSIRNAGLEIDFADIDPETFCLSPAAVESRMDSRVTGIVPIHVYGNICDIEAFDRFRKQGIKVVYDAAHAFGVTRSAQQAGAWGDAEVFSFHATKILSACEGGAITTLDPDLARRVRLHSNFGILNELEVDMIGSNAKMSEVHALFGLYSLRNLSASIEKRTSLVEAYRQRLRTHPAIIFPKQQTAWKGNGQYCPILLESGTLRDRLYDNLKAQEVFCRKYFFPCLHQLKPYVNQSHSGLKNAENISSRILCLPLHGLMSTDDIDFVCERISKII